MIFSQLAKFKKAAAVILLVCFLFPTITQPILAYDSTPAGGETGLIEYYGDSYEPALEAPEMNLESFVNETAKALFWGVPIYYLTKVPLFNALYFTAICSYKFAQDGTIPAVDCVVKHIPPQFTDLIQMITDAITDVLSSSAIQQPQENIFASAFKGTVSLSRTMPISTAKYFNWLGQKMGLASPAYAQGFGYTAMGGLIPYWTAFRNAAYALSAIFLVIAGLMVMFRMKISPQTVITVQQAIPKAIITLLLITFSYAIAGFVLDLIWFFTFLLFNLFAAGFVKTGFGRAGKITADMRISLTKDNALVFIFQHGLFKSFIATVWGMTQMLYAMLGGIVAVIGGILLVPIWLLIGVMILWKAIKITWMLLKAFVMIALYTIIAPLWILLGILPRAPGFSSWFREILSQAAIFPVVALLLAMASVFMGGGGVSTAERIRLPLMGSLEAEHVVMILGLGIYFFIPKIAETIQQLTKSIGGGMGSGLGEAFAPLAAGAAWGRRTATGFGIQQFGESAQARETSAAAAGAARAAEAARAKRMVSFWKSLGYRG